MANVPITKGDGSASVATETVAGLSYQQIQVYGQGGASILGVNPDGSLRASIIGIPTTVHPGGSVTTVANVAGSIAAVSATAPAGSVMATNQVAGSIMATSAIQPAGSVMAVRTDATSVIVTFQNSSIFTNQTGSVIAVLQAPSIVGTYAEDSPSANTDKGIFVLGVRNDTLASVTSADGDYGAYTVGPSGEVIVANAPLTKFIQAQTSVMYGVSVQAVAAQGTSIFTYITGIHIANDSATFSRVKITGGLGSVLAWTVAPANGGSNMNFPNGLKTGENSGVSASISGVSSVYVTMTGFISKS